MLRQFFNDMIIKNRPIGLINTNDEVTVRNKISLIKLCRKDTNLFYLHNFLSKFNPRFNIFNI